MEIVDGHRLLAQRLRGPVVAIGNFDGAHLGHRRIFAEVCRRSRARGGEAVALTFDPHPARALSPSLAPPLITTRARKEELLAEAGLDLCIHEPFVPSLWSLSPREFVALVLGEGLGAREVCVGGDFTFGKQRAGSASSLVALGEEFGVAVTVVEPVAVGGIVCSSTKVREFVLEGRVDGAALLLGRDHDLDGTVVSGEGRGSTIGVPTANLAPDTELVPAPGVYGGWARLASGERRAAAINIGRRPTFSGTALSIEAHLLDFPARSLEGERLRLGFRKRLRDEQRFPSVESLVEQIGKDLAATRALGAATEEG